MQLAVPIEAAQARVQRPSQVFAQVLAALGALALTAAWLAPNHYPPWTSFHGEAAAFAALCLLAAARAGAPEPLQVGRGLWVPSFLVALIAIQWATGRIPYSGDALLSACYVAGAAIAFSIGMNTRGERGRDALTLLAASVLTAACLSVLIALLQWLRMEMALGIFAANRDPDARVFANLAQPNHLATLCVMATVLALWLRLRGALKRWQCILLVLWLSAGVTLTESRSGLLSAGVAGVLLLWGRRLLPDARSNVAVWWGALAAGWLAFPRLSAGLLLEATRTMAVPDNDLRVVMWRQSLVAIREAPWAGHGWRQTLFALKHASLEAPGRVPTDYAHNIGLDLLIWVGVPLALLLVGAAVWWLLRAWHRIHDGQQLLLLAACVPVLVHSQFEFPFAYSYFLFPVCGLLGLLAAAQVPAPQAAPSTAPKVRALAFFVVLAYAALCTALAGEYLDAEEDFRVMRFELRKVGQVPVGHEAPHLPLLTQLRDLLEVGRIEPKAGLGPEQLQRMGVAAARNGWATLDLNYAVALALNGRTADAERQLANLSTVYGKASAQQAYDMFRAFQAAHPEVRQVRVP